jgi:hypothetical protein
MGRTAMAARADNPAAHPLSWEHKMLLRTCSAATLSLLISLSAGASTRCDEVLKKIGKDLADATCFESTDLTTNNPATTPANNSIASLPSGAFTPITDRSVITPSAAKRPHRGNQETRLRFHKTD